MKDIYDILRQWRERPDANFALATMVRTQGSSYRRPGARMLICEDGTTVGSLSAGCLESEVAECAREVFRTGQSVVVSFDTRRRFGCAGKIDIFIERMSQSFLCEVAACLNARRTCFAVTTLEGSFVGEADSFLREADSFLREANGFPYSPFVQKISPPLRLLIFGDGPDNAPFRSLGHFLGWDVIEIIDANLFSIAPDPWTAAIVKSHNYGPDFVMLQKLLPMELRYVGLIGPRKRRDQIMSELLGVGITVNAGFFAPAGLNLGAETPEEIALEIVAEIQRVFAHGSGLSLREKKIPIHVALKCADSHALSKR
jgi:xanthine/CO dehydrogenase XdhC/CoxF family maturation factor